MKRIAGALCAFVSLSVMSASAAWAPGLAGGYYHSSDYGKSAWNTDNIWLTGSPAVTNSYSGPHAATNRVDSSTAETRCPPIWANQRTWVYSGQMFLSKGTHWFCGQIDDGRWVKLDGTVIMNSTSWNGCIVSSPGYTVTEDEGRWVDIEIRMSNGSGGAGYNNGVKDANGLLCGFGHAVADTAPSASMANFVYPCDPGDKSVFRHDDGLGWNDCIEFTALPAEYPVAGVSYATTNGVSAGDTFTLSVPAGTQVVADGVRVICVGYKVYSVNIETQVKTLVDEGNSNSFTYTHPANAMGEVVWLWQVENRISASAGEGGSVSSAEQWAVRDAATTVTATADADHHFYRWTGDVPYGQVFSPTLTLDYHRPASVTALFEADGTPGTKLYTGASNGKWSVDGNWTPAGVPSKDDAVFIRPGVNVELDCVADIASLVISNGSCVSANFASGKMTTRTRDAATIAADGEYGIRARGDLTMLGNAKIYLGGYGSDATHFEVGGNLSLAGTANELAIYAGPAATAGDWFNGGTRAVVGGMTTIASGCWIYSYAHTRPTTTAPEAIHATGAPVVFDLCDLSVASGGGFNANTLGYGRCSSNPATGDASNNSYGGGYGGRGGRSGYGPYGYALAPFHPGMKAGNNGPSGGGSIRIAAKNVTLAGTLTANNDPNIGRQGSGGGIWLTCDALDAPGATIKAESNYRPYNSDEYGSYDAGGGGGRIAIGLGLATWQIEDLIASGATDGIAIGTPESVLGVEFATISAAGSRGGDATTEGDGADGTVAVYVSRTSSQVALFVTTDVDADLDPGASPSLGHHLLAAGASVNGATFPAAAVSLVADGSLRQTCSGWTLTFADGTTASGNGAVVSGVPALDQDATITWHLASPEAKPITSAIGDTTATVAAGWGAVGSPVTVTAIPGNADFEFQYWIGDVPYSNRYDNPLVVPAAAHFDATAFFGRKVGAAIRSENNSDRRQFFDPANWVGRVIPGTNDTAIVYSSGMKQMMQAPAFIAVKNLVVSNAYLLVNCTSGYDSNPTSLSRDVTTPANRNRHAVLDTSRTEPFGMDISGDLLLDRGGYIYLGGMDQNALSKVKVGGDCTLQNGYYLQWGGINHQEPAIDHAKLYPVEGGLAPYFKGYNTFDVAGDTVIRSGSWIVPMGDYRTGVSPWMTFKNLVVDEGGGFNGSHAGFARGYYLGTRRYYTCPAGISDGDNQHGGAYGGRGGNNSANSYNTNLKTYGFENAPLYPGSSKYSWRDDGSSGGGGAIHIEAESMTLNGSVMATCGEDNVSKGGKAGGGAWICAKTISIGENAKISVAGGKGGGGGGGGRAALCVGLTDEQIESLAFSEEHTAEGVNITSLADFLGDRFDCAGGASPSGTQGEPGTGVYIVNTAGAKVLTVAGLPANFGAVVPPYGPWTLSEGTVTNASAPPYVDVSGDNTSRRVCTGYTVSNAATGAVTTGAGTSVFIEMTDDIFLTWLYTNLQHAVAASVEGGGSISTGLIDNASSVWQSDGSTYRFTAVPDEGYVFAGWTGDVPVEQRESATIDLAAEFGRAPVAVFVTDATGDKVWTGAGDGSSWFDDSNWSPAGVPGPHSRVTIPTGFTVAADYGIPVMAGSLEIAAGSTLGVQIPSTFSTDVRPPHMATEPDYYKSSLRIGGSFNLGGTLTIGRQHSMSLSSLSVGGDLALGTNALLKAYAGYRLLQHDSYDGWDVGGGSVSVGCAMTLESGAWVIPGCNGMRGAPVVFDVGPLSVATNAGFNATDKGYTYTVYDSVNYCYCPGIVNYNQYAGSSFAALGGTSSEGHTPQTRTYGSAIAPFVPGCCGRDDGYGYGAGYGHGYAGGGGAIRIRSRGLVRLKGSLIANGQDGSGSQGGGTGGSIWITAPRVKMTADAVVEAIGGGAVWGAGCGSGGRICIAEGLTDAQIASLAATGTATGRFTVNDLVADVGAKASLVKGTLTAVGGFKAEGSVQNGGDGTEIWITSPPAASIFMMR